MKREITNSEKRVCELLLNRPLSRVPAIACWRTVFREESKGLDTAMLNDIVKRFQKRPEVIEYMESLREYADTEIKLRVSDFIDEIVNRAIDPSARFTHMEYAPIERTNKKTGEVLGYEFAPVVNSFDELPPELLPYVEQIVWEDGCGKFRVVPREDVDVKTRAKYADMVLKAMGGYAPERLEVTGRDGGPVHSISADMDAVTAAEIYRNAVKGVDK